MRIPSQFSEDNLYRRGNPGRTPTDHRRLVRLCVVLGLVLVVMHYAAKPAVYAPFFVTSATSETTAGTGIRRTAAVVAEASVEDGRIARTLRQAIDQALASLDDVLPPQRAKWSAMLDAIAGNEQALTDRSPAIALLAALDKAAAEKVVDGSVWRADDFDALYRYLDQSKDFSPHGVSATGVLPLLQQPDVFRNQLVRIHGSVARIERIQAPHVR